jgi:hypothetical protein
MTTYLILDNQLRSETDSEVIANLRRKGWQDAPAKPSEDAQWQDGQWVVPPAATFTAEQWVAKTLSPLQVAALSEFRMALLQAGKPLGTNMMALKGWLEAMMAESVDPTPRSFAAAPCSYEDAASEALVALQN